MTVEELTALGRFPWHGALGRFGTTDRAQVAEALRRTELTGMAAGSSTALSGGERQRAWLSMMLAQDTRCVILDEPTSALDIAHQDEMLALLHELTRERSLAVVVVLHDINMAARYCDELLALKGGRIMARGAPRLWSRRRRLAPCTTCPWARSAIRQPGSLSATSFEPAMNRRLFLACSAASLASPLRAAAPRRIAIVDWALLETVLALGVVPRRHVSSGSSGGSPATRPSQTASPISACGGRRTWRCCDWSSRT